LEALPGVESIAFVDALPRQRFARIPYEVAGMPAVEVRQRPVVSKLVISQAYFRTLGAAILAGRDFTNADGGAGPPVAIVNQQFANTQWPGEDPVGKRLRLFAGATSGEWLTVVGVASNVAQSSAIRQFDPVVYVPYRQRPAGGMWAIMRTRVPPATLGAAFRHEVQTLDEDLAVWNGPSTMSDRMAYVYWNRGVNGVLFLIFAAIALLLAAIGLYSVVAHAVSQRTQEIGIRTAMGASARDILNLVFKQGMLPVGVGLTIGLVAALAVTPLLKSQLIEVSPVDPVTLVAASATLIVSAAVGCWIPARRAIRVDPVVALRHE
jgi:putative ABC transport system permease protein